MQILDSTQTVQTHPFAQQLHPSRQRSKLHYVCQARQESSHFCCRHRFQHRLDCIVVFSFHSNRVATDHGKELTQLFCRGTVSEHVTRIELSINTFLFEVFFSSSSCSQQCLTSRCFILPTPLLWQNARATSASVCRTIGRSPIPQNSKLYCISLASFKTSLMLMISLSPLLSACCPVVLLWLCSRQPPTIKYPPDADFLSRSSQAQSPSRKASMMSGLLAFGMNVAKSLDPLMYLTVLTNCLHDFWLGFLSLLHNIKSC